MAYKVEKRGGVDTWPMTRPPRRGPRRGGLLEGGGRGVVGRWGGGLWGVGVWVLHFYPVGCLYGSTPCIITPYEYINSRIQKKILGDLAE